MEIDLTKAYKNLQIPAGEIILAGNKSTPTLNILHSGSIDVFVNASSGTELRIETLQAPCFINELIFSGCPYSEYIYKISQTAVISIYPLKSMTGLFASKTVLAGQVVQHMISRFEKNAASIKKYIQYLKNILTTVHGLFVYLAEKQINLEDNSLEAVKAKIYGSYLHSGKELVFNANMFDEIIFESASDACTRFNSLQTADNDIFQLIRQIFLLPQDILAKIFTTGENLTQTLFNSLASKNADLLESLETCITETQYLLHLLTGKSSSLAGIFAETVLTDDELNSQAKDSLLSSLARRIAFFLNSHLSLFGTQYINFDPLINHLQSAADFTKHQEAFKAAPPKIYAPEPSSAAQESHDDLLDFLDGINDSPAAAAPAVPDDTGVEYEMPKVFENYFSKVIAYTQYPPAEADELKKLLEKYSAITDKKNLDSDGRKIKRDVEKKFWKLYGEAAYKKIHGRRGVEDIDFFLKYGILDEKLLNARILSKIHSLPDTDKTGLSTPVLLNWLRTIYGGEEIPSINELGIDYGKFEREREKNMSAGERDQWAKKSEDEKTKERMLYEISNMVHSAAHTINASSASSFPVLIADNIVGDISSNFIKPRELEKIINELRETDFSLFYRETLYKVSSNRNEIIMKEVLPHFIIFPMAGDRVIFWQDLSGANKSSRGRFVIPVFFNGDLKKSLIIAVASFKWELNRSIKGASWADPVEGGITGSFYDYITFYKRNQNLSIEAKDKIKKLIDDNRKDLRRIFTWYYYQWVEYEKNGTLKLDRIARDFFFLHCPFTKAIRDQIVKIPAYSDLNRKYTIITERNLTRLENKFKKLRDENGILPPELQEHLDYYCK